MDFATKNNFIVAHAGAEHFDKDMQLFKKTFPESKLLPQLQKANQFNKKQLDERMLLEMLDHVSIDGVVKNRGGKTKAAKKTTTKKATTKRKRQAKKTPPVEHTTQKKSGGQE